MEHDWGGLSVVTGDGPPASPAAAVFSRLASRVYSIERSQWVNDPDTGKRQRKERPESEWHIHTDEEMRIATPELWAATLRRFKVWKRAHSCGVGEATRAAWAQAPTERAAEVRALRATS